MERGARKREEGMSSEVLPLQKGEGGLAILKVVYNEFWGSFNTDD